MGERETIRGPYQMYLRQVRATVGERVWEHLCGLSCVDADVILRSMGVVPFLQSNEHWEWLLAFEGRDGVNVKVEAWDPAKAYKQSPRAVLKDPARQRDSDIE